MGYRGQEEEPEAYKLFDGCEVFTESIRNRANKALKGNLDPEIGAILLKLATQDPHPSFQAQYYIEQFRQKKIYFPHPENDLAVNAAWEAEGLGFTHLAQTILSNNDISCELMGDGK